MRTFKVISITVLTIFIILAIALNVVMINQQNHTDGQYRVEVKRLADEIEETGSYNPANYSFIKGVYTGENLYKNDAPYVIIEVKETLYRVEYTTGNKNILFIQVNCILSVMFLLMCCVLVYIWHNVIKPFGSVQDVPLQLAKGNLAVPILEQKSRFLGNFTWGVNLLREKIEEDRQKEFAMQRDKKLLLMSLSHDIKTPLSAIKLNAKALAKGIYKDEDRCRIAAESINTRADEIEHFVSEISKASSEDFMNFEVNQGEAFLSQIITKVQARYKLQFEGTGTEFTIHKYDECILSCDADRLVECLQNLIENAIKYSDGKRIEINFDKIDGCELITVTNSGCTLEKEEVPQIFSSFYRGKNADKMSGNGLGLFICKKLISLMGGEVYAEIKDGCFSVTLVVKQA